MHFVMLIRWPNLTVCSQGSYPLLWHHHISRSMQQHCVFYLALTASGGRIPGTKCSSGEMKNPSWIWQSACSSVWTQNYNCKTTRQQWYWRAVMREQMEYLVYVDGIVLRHQILALLSVSNDLTELKDSIKHKWESTYQLLLFKHISWEYSSISQNSKHKTLNHWQWPTGGELSGSLGNSMGPNSPVKKIYFFLTLFYFLNFIEC